MKRFSTLLAAGALAAALAPLAGAQTYGLTFFDNQLISIDAAGTGSLIGTLDAAVSGYGLAFRGDRLYTFDPNVDRIREINTTTAQVSTGVDIGVGDLIGEGDLAFRGDGVGFLASALSPDFEPTNDLFRFDADLGTSVRIGSTAVPLDGLVFVGDTLYAIGQEGTPSLYIVDQMDASLTAVGLLGIPQNSPFLGLTAGTGGNLLGVIDDRLYSIDLMTGVASAVSTDVLDVGFASVSGVATRPAGGFAPVPEPATYGALAAGGLALVCWRRRRRGAGSAPATTLA